MALDRRCVPSGDTRSPVTVLAWPFSVIATSAFRRSQTWAYPVQLLVANWASIGRSGKCQKVNWWHGPLAPRPPQRALQVPDMSGRFRPDSLAAVYLVQSERHAAQDSGIQGQVRPYSVKPLD